jgi:outer membrane protein assembly factor BamB
MIAFAVLSTMLTCWADPVETTPTDAPGRTMNWPQFRGENSSGMGIGEDLPIEWSEQRNIAWKIPLPGLAWSSPIVWQGKVIVTTASSDRKPEEPKKGLYFGGERREPVDAHFKLEVWCLDLKTGKEIWRRCVLEGKPKAPIHIKNTYASETPVTDGKRIVASFGSMGVYCLDMDGNPQWQFDLGNFPMKMGWGTGSSPVLADDVAFFQVDNEKQSSVIAVDAKDGKELWRKSRKEKSSWSTPFVWTHSLRKELVTCASNKVRSYDPKSGDLLWEIGPNSVIAVPSPVLGKELLYVSSGYVLDPRHKPIYAIRPGAKGDLSPDQESSSKNGLAWTVRLGGAYMPSPVYADGRLYVLYDQGFLSCFDGETGNEIYKRQRIGRGGEQFTASPWSYRGYIFCGSESGNTFVIKAGPQFELVGTNRLNGMIMASPAIADGRLLLRTDQFLYCIKQ